MAIVALFPRLTNLLLLGLFAGLVTAQDHDPRTQAPGHWAFEAMQRPAPPGVADADWSRNPIDRFVYDRLQREGLAPAPRADRRTLLRRATEPGTAVPAPHAPSDRDIALVVSVLAWSGATDATAADRAWRAAAGVHPAIGTGPFPAAQCTLDALDGSLRALASARPAMRRAMVDACVAAVTADGRTTVDEAELLRAACAAVGAPMPPIAAAA